LTDLGNEKIAELEAVLYASGRPLGLATLCAHLRLQTEKEVSDLISRLSEIYESEGSPLEVREVSNRRFVLQLKPNYTRQALDQKSVAEGRGSQAYKHLKMLDQMGLIIREKMGRNTIIRTTPDFADYLGLSQERSIMRRQLRSMFRKLEVKEIEKK
jgi:segregation and condensation protein B